MLSSTLTWERSAKHENHKIKIVRELASQNISHDYVDGYSIALDAKDITIEQVGKSFFTSGPAWVDWLLVTRNRIVSIIGLKIPGAETKEEVLRNFHCEVGECVGLFNVLAKAENEVILGEDDKHLDFRVSIFLDRQDNRLIVSTTVDIHNWLGRLYLLSVKPFHKLIVPTVVRGMVRELGRNRNFRGA